MKLLNGSWSPFWYNIQQKFWIYVMATLVIEGLIWVGVWRLKHEKMTKTEIIEIFGISIVANLISAFVGFFMMAGGI